MDNSNDGMIFALRSGKNYESNGARVCFETDGAGTTANVFHYGLHIARWNPGASNALSCRFGDYSKERGVVLRLNALIGAFGKELTSVGRDRGILVLRRRDGTTQEVCNRNRWFDA